MATRTVREDCFCCGGSKKCCEFGAGASLPFTPDTGWTLESVAVSNSGANNCVGRAVADIVLSKPADPQPDCQTLNLGCGRFCKDGFRGNFEDFEANDTLMWAKLTEWVNAFTPFVPAGWIRTDRGVGWMQDWYSTGMPAPTCSTWRWRSMQAAGAKPPCAGECGASTVRVPFFTYVPIDPAERYHSTRASRDAIALSKEVEFKAAFDAWWASSDNPSIKWTMGTCDYEMTPNRAGVSIRKTLMARCATYISANPPSQRWVWCNSNMYDFSQTTSLPFQGTFSIRCAGEPCIMADYNWPLTLPCTCVAEYEKVGLTAKPACELFLISTRREWTGEKCLFIAQYGGAIEAGEVVCEPASTLPDCICCEEP